jgi:hypothetical protein
VSGENAVWLVTSLNICLPFSSLKLINPAQMFYCPVAVTGVVNNSRLCIAAATTIELQQKRPQNPPLLSFRSVLCGGK